MDRTVSQKVHARRSHARLLASCALGLVLAATPQAAFAQNADKGFQGSGTVDAGGAVVFTGGTGSKFTGIDVSAPQTVITWKPDDGATSGTIDFLPEGYTAAFSSSSLGDYTVLNRILPGGTATIGINGSITSSVSNGDGQSAGGNVWFYTPNGFVVGPNAVIQVGGLVMTTNDITYSIDPQNGNANFLDANGAINFRGPDGSKGSIVNNGTIGSGSYLALVAPRIVQNGSVNAAGAVAYVAAEQADLTINAGNFNIAIGQGTTDTDGIVHDGAATTNAPSVQIVAVPKNTALTMLLSGSIGYTPADGGFNQGGAIILTAGTDGSPDGNIEIGQSQFHGSLIADATGDITVAPAPPPPFSEGTSSTLFEGYTQLRGNKSVHLTAAGGTEIRALNGLEINSDSAAGGGAITLQALGGEPFTPAGQVAVTGFFEANARHFGNTSDDGTTGLDSQGGSVTIAADGGQIGADYMYLYAGGYGGFGSKSGGIGQGGTIDVSAGFGGAINTGNLYADAEGHGGGSYDFSQEIAIGGQGGVGRGGTITIADSAGTVDEDPAGGSLNLSSIYLNASAIGGNSLNRASGMGGDAFGGTVDLTFNRQNQSFSYLDAYARAVDGDGGSQDPLGGTITMNVGGGISVDLYNLYLDAGIEASVNSVAGAYGKGGTIDLTIDGDALLSVFNQTQLRSEAEVSSFFFTTADTSPDLTGGTVNLTADGGFFTTSNLDIDVSAYNVGAATSAGFSHGGAANVTAANGGFIQVQGSDCSECFSGNFEIDAEGYGTSGLSPNLVTGGDIKLAAESGGTISADFGTIYLYAGTSYGLSQSNEGTGVTAQGGTIKIDALGGTIATGIYADASGQGGDADSGGGSGTGGSIDVRVLDGGTLVDSLYASASGSGGYAYIDGRGGDGIGGRFTLTSDASATFTNFGLDFYGNGQGGSTNSGVGGDGYGGSAQVEVIGGTHSWYELYLSGYGQGSSGFGNGSLAGSAYGSVDGINVHIGGGADLTLGYLGIDARAAAGADGDGNEAIGGSASLLVDQLASLTADGIGVNAGGMLAFEERSSDSYDTTPNAHGGTASAIANGGTITTPFLEVTAKGMTGGALTSAGTATGGTSTVGSSNGGLIDIIDPGFQGEGQFIFGGLVVEAQGLGAEGPSAANATGGTATLYTAGGAISSVSGITVNADATAGNFAGAFAYSGTPANGFDATGGTASVEMRTGGSGGGAIDAPSLTVKARGLPNGDDFFFPPVQGNGGVGTGGTATLDVAQGSLTTGNIVVDADGIGGSSGENSTGGAAFLSGAGNGGTATFAISGGSIITTDISVTAQGVGASGQGESQGSTPSLAGSGTGGIARFIASGGTLNDSGGVSVQAVGSGGEGAFNPNGGPGGNGGDAFGGTALFSAPAGSTASLGIADDIRVDASAFGGGASGSVTEQEGNGGSAAGGDASMALADIPFTFGLVQIDALASPGTGAIGGDGSGGSASFSLIDTLGAGAAPRTIDSLNLNAASYAGAGAASVGGSTAFTAQVAGAASALSITNDLSLYAYGNTGAAGFGFTGSISGAPVAVGGDVSIITPRDAVLTIAGAGALNAGGELDISVGRTFTSSGLLSAGGNASVSADGGINITDLAVGGSTFLNSFGPVVISYDLRSVGQVTVSGQSVSIFSLGGLTFADADATGGDLEIETAGDLLLATVDATGAVALTSNDGSIHNTGAVDGVGISYTAAGDVTSDAALASSGDLSVDAGGAFSAPGTVSAVGNVSLSADLGMALAGVVSGGTTLLQADNGALSVDSLTSPGLVTALARSITIASPGALSFGVAQATAGNLNLTTAGNLAVAQGGASGAVNLTSTGGTVSGAGSIAAGGDVGVSGANGIALGTLTSGGTTALTSASGSVAVDNLNSAGPVTARGTLVDINSSGALAFADLDAAAGNITVRTAGNLTLDTVDATGSITLSSTFGALNANGTLSGSAITLASLANLQLGSALSTPGAIRLISTSGSVSAANPITSGGNLSVSGNSGITLGTANVGGTTGLLAANGAIAISNLSSAGTVLASGRSIDVASPGALGFANVQATAGNLKLTTAGNLAVTQGSATGTLSLTSSGGTVSSSGTLASGGNAAVAGRNGVTLAALASGGTTALSSAAGSVVVNSLTSAGRVTASGRWVGIVSPGALTFANAQATAGNLNLTTAGNLSLAQAGATGTLGLTSTGGSVTGTGPITAGGNAAVSGNTGIALTALTSGGATSLASANGGINVANLNSVGAVTASGRSVDLASSGALTFADLDATAGDAAVRTTGNLAVGTADATGSITLTSTGGSVSAAGLVAAGGGLAVSGDGGIALDAASSGGTTSLASANGTIAVSSLASAGAVSAVGRSVDIVSPGALTIANVQATAGNLNLTTAGNLSLAQGAATGTLGLTSTGASVTGPGPIASGGNAAVSGNAGIALAALTSGGTTSLASANGGINVANLNSVGAVTASGRSVDLASSGALTVADLDATAGNAAVVTAGNLTVGTIDATGSATLTSTGGALQATGAINANGIALSALANLQTSGLATAGAISLTSTGGAVSAAGPVSAGVNLSVSGDRGIALGSASSGGSTSLVSANGAIGVTNLNSAGPVAASGRSVTIASTGALAFADLDATAGNVAVQTAGNLAVGSVDATGSVALTSTGGAVAATGPVSAGGNVSASGQTGVGFGNLASGGTTALSAPGGAIAVTALTSIGAVTATGRSIDLRAPGSLTVANADATAGDLALQAGQGLTVASASASGTATLTAGGDLRTTGLVNAAAANLAAANVTIGGQVRTTGDLSIRANQLFTLSGLATGRAIAVDASDIAIGATGRLGSRGLTQTIALRNLAMNSPMNIGGAGQQGEFSLDKNEAARLFADQQISFIALGGEGLGGDVRIGELALSFGDQTNIGVGGLLKVDAGGLVEVNGAVTLTTVSDDDAFSIDPQRIDVIAGDGSIVMRNAAGALQGVLELQADTIVVASRSTLDAIASLDDFAAISSALDTPGPAGPEGGYLQAGTINLIAGDAILIQNGGATTAYDDRRGFFANALNIETESSNPFIAINGVISQPLGDLFGQQTARAVSINGTFAIDLPTGANVTINGCAATGCAVTPEFFFSGPSSDDLELVVTTSNEGTHGPTAQLVQVESNQPLITPPLVDEPITGVGNDDLWQVKCTAEGDKSGCPTEGSTE